MSDLKATGVLNMSTLTQVKICKIYVTEFLSSYLPFHVFYPQHP